MCVHCPLRVTCPRSLTRLVVRRWPGWTSSGTGFTNDGSYGLRAVVEHCLPYRGRVGDRRVEEPCHGTVRGASPGRAAAGTQFQSPRQGRRWLGVCPRLAVRSGTCRHALSNDSQGVRSVQGATGCESVSTQGRTNSRDQGSRFVVARQHTSKQGASYG